MLIVHSETAMPVRATAACCCGTSTKEPRPVRDRCRSAARIAKAAVTPPTISGYEQPMRSGASSSYPVMPAIPLWPSRVGP